VVLKELSELLDTNSRLSQDGAQSSTVDLMMIGNNSLCEWIVSPHDKMAPLLTTHRETDFLQRPHHFLAGHLRELAHTAMSSASKCSSGTAMPSS